MTTPLAIIGIGCLFPKANDLSAFWSLLKNGTDAITPIPPTHWNPADYFDPDPKKPDLTYAQRGAFLDPYPFAPGEFGIAPNDLEATDTAQLLGLVAAKMALRDAGYGPERQFNRDRVSVVLGVTGTLELVVPLGARLGHPRWRQAMRDAGIPEAAVEDAVSRIGETYVGWQENSFPGLLGNVVAGRIANRLDLHGTNCVVDAACASSLSAMHLAGLELAAGRSDLVVTGGVDTFNDIFMYMCFSKTPALSPTGDARPFAASGDGTILGEGLGIVVLKRLADAEKDGDRIYAVIRGLGSSSDGKGNAIYAPSADGQKRCLVDAYRQADVTPDTIDLVEAHGTGTKVGDATEIKALTEIYREAKADGAWCALGSVKSQIGHTKAAAGAAGIIKAALALYHKVLPPTIKVDQPAESLAAKTPFYVNTVKRPWLPRNEHPRRAGVSAFGFGGSNFHCVLEEYRPTKQGVDWDGEVQIVALSADNADTLKSSLPRWEVLDWNELSRQAAESRKSFRSDAKCRLVLVLARTGPAIAKVLTSARRLLDESAGKSFAASMDGAYFGRSDVNCKLGVLFPGQGSQYVGMLRDLACQFPVMQETLAEANTAYFQGAENHSDWRLSDRIYPHPAFHPEDRAAQEKDLRATNIAQPAIGAVSLGAMRVLDGFGVHPDAAAGHSFGELTALCVAGCYDSKSLHSLSRLRGQLMSEVREGDPGSMLAVHAPVEQIEQAIREEKLDLVIANRNSPRQSVLSGATHEIERAAKVLTARQMKSSRLPVAAAFHSPLVAVAERPFREALERIRLQAARIPVYANTTAERYPVDASEMRRLLAGQLARPVNFVQEITSMIEAGVRTFVEVGPGQVLTRLVESIAKDQNRSDIEAISIDASTGKQSGILDLAQGLARLAAIGHSVKLFEWENGPANLAQTASAKAGLVVPICGANYVKPKPKRPLAKAASVPQPLTKEPHSKSIAPPSLAAIPTAQGDAKSTAPVIQSHLSQTVPEKKTVSHSNHAPPGSALAQALQITQEGLSAFQRLQEQTAQLHRQFLQTQESAQQALSRLIEQQRQLLLGNSGFSPPPQLRTESPPPAPISAAPAFSPKVVESFKPAVQPPVRPVTPQTPVGSAQNRPTSTGRDRIQRILLEVVSEKTGYPSEMLSPEMGLDADLGIDSIKRVEILSALHERLPEAPEIKAEHLGTLNTLGQIIDFLASGQQPIVVNHAAAPATPSSAAPDADRSKVQQILLEVVSEKTGYPAEMLNPEMGLDADLGIDSIKRVEILSALQERLPNAPAVKSELLGTLNTLGHIVDFLANGHAAPATGEPAKTVSNGAGPISRQTLRSVPVPFDHDRSALTLPPETKVVLVAGADKLADQVANAIRARGILLHRVDWNSPIDCPSNVAGVVLLAPEDPKLEVLRSAFRRIRAAAQSLQTAGERSGALLAAISRMGGSLGLRDFDGNLVPFDGGLSGLVKTAAHEWPNVSCKAIDIDVRLPRIADQIADELLLKGPGEVGIGGSGRQTFELTDSLSASIDPDLLGPKDVVVISGGARGVTAEAALALARQYRPTLILLGRSPLPDDEPEWLRGLTDEREIKRLIAIQANGSGSPREINRRYREFAAQREIRANLERIAAAGSRVSYRSVDVRDRVAVQTLFKQIQTEFGPITGLIHGAGVIEDRLIVDKTDEQFDRVVGTKVEGLLNLLAAVGEQSLKVLALFSSSTARFGRTGQADYAVANEVLNKIARREASRRPNCRVVSINWGPWSGGMVTPELQKLFESEGVGLIPLQEGAHFLLSELSDARRDVEVVAVVWSGKTANEATVDSSTEVTPVSETLAKVWERHVDVASHPVLASHIIGEQAVVPLALHVEWLVHTALHGNPGFLFHGLDNLRVLNGIKIGPEQSVTIAAMAGKARKHDGTFVVPVELRGMGKAGRPIVYSQAEVVLVSSLPADRPRLTWSNGGSANLTAADAYSRILFHGAALHGLTSIDDLGTDGISATSITARPPVSWMEKPLRNNWLAEPLALDSALQAMIVLGVHRLGVPNLPMSAARYRQFRRTFSAGPVRIAARITSVTGPVIRADIEWTDGDGVLIARLEGGEFVSDQKLAQIFRQSRDALPVA